MKIILNNRETQIDRCDELTITELLKRVKYTFPNIVVKVNRQLVKKDHWSTVTVRDGDRVDAIHMIGGG